MNKLTSGLIWVFRRLRFLPERRESKISLFEEIYGYQNGSDADLYVQEHNLGNLSYLPAGIKRVK